MITNVSIGRPEYLPIVSADNLLNTCTLSASLNSRLSRSIHQIGAISAIATFKGKYVLRIWRSYSRDRLPWLTTLFTSRYLQINRVQDEKLDKPTKIRGRHINSLIDTSRSKIEWIIRARSNLTLGGNKFRNAVFKIPTKYEMKQNPRENRVVINNLGFVWTYTIGVELLDVSIKR